MRSESDKNEAPWSSSFSTSRTKEIAELELSLQYYMNSLNRLKHKSIEWIKSHPIQTKLNRQDVAVVQSVLLRACAKFPDISLADRFDLITWLIEKKGAKLNEPGMVPEFEPTQILPMKLAVRYSMDLVKFLMSKGGIIPPNILSALYG